MSAELYLSRDELTKLQNKYPGRVPVILSRAKSSDIPELPKRKFIVPRDLTLGQFMFVVRKHLTLPPEKALFLFINNTLAPTSVAIFELYAAHMCNDGALHMTYASESAFGSTI